MVIAPIAEGTINKNVSDINVKALSQVFTLKIKRAIKANSNGMPIILNSLFCLSVMMSRCKIVD
ncbi:hypothetical protein GCM10011425_03930 [Mucilaginibacter galii]|uniref:Uncharacterized protein n=1 Tax=Mucilaginibacter galii TaxID=2005073 RepID=A0A917J826_9SPHI|nr:hypothetical protein GCM10011425_03930 [Mucilaginibacter galii]